MATVKSAISFEKPLFERTERMAREKGISRSRVVNLALRAFFSREEDRELLARINAACGEGPDEDERELRKHLNAHYRKLAEHLWQ